MVWVKRGICSGDSIINIALCILGFLPGLFHSWYIIAKYPDNFDDGYAPMDQESHVHTYRSRCRNQHQHQQPPRQGGLIYSQHHPPPPEREGYGSFNVVPASEPHAGHSQRAGGNGGSSSQGEPPSYASVVKGDNKVQHD